MTDVLVVAVEEIWPPRQGGQVRVAGLIDAIGSKYSVAVAVPVADSSRIRPVPVYDLAAGHPRSQLRHFVSPQPRLGRTMMGAAGPVNLSELVGRLEPKVLLFTQSYLAAVAQPTDLPTIVDFQNIEASRLRSFAGAGSIKNRFSALAESMKARVWEPRVARKAGLCLALSTVDAAALKQWGANAVHVPNGVRAEREITRSPAEGYTLYLGSADYPPNRQAAEWLVERVWPLVRSGAPSARLVLAGRKTGTIYSRFASAPGVEVIGEVDDVAPLLEGAATVLAPVNCGGGQQLKVIEAISYGRVVVATPYSARSVPEGLAQLCISAEGAQDFATAVVTVLRDAPRRWELEQAATSRVKMLQTWGSAASPVIAWIEGQR